jgi:hypothetical protein
MITFPFDFLSHVAAFDSDCFPLMPARHLFSTGNPKNSLRHSKARLCALRGHLVATIWTMVPRTCEPFFISFLLRFSLSSYDMVLMLALDVYFLLIISVLPYPLIPFERPSTVQLSVTCGICLFRLHVPFAEGSTWYRLVDKCLNGESSFHLCPVPHPIYLGLSE